ncbi:putative beta-flanking protein [Rhizoctonia solani 123E]|uniref:Putative beta-flanking protein n=1 Tax=Rhizoctonia solani 123E TaxID=1423351 RepID=A0A074S7L3_9AGAM|nr:putative beta-flanking protein [Rhizoctonia solani 123E]
MDTFINLAKQGYETYNESQHGQHGGQGSPQGATPQGSYGGNPTQGGYGHNQPSSGGYDGSQYGPPIDHHAAVQNATQHSGGAGDPSLFDTALGFIKQNQSQHTEPINEQNVQSAHTEAYEKGKASSLDAGSLGAAAAMQVSITGSQSAQILIFGGQVLKKFTSGEGSTGSGGGNTQSQLISLAMSEASKLFESQGSKSGQKQDAVNGAAMTIMKLLVQSKTGSGATNAGGNDLGSLLSLNVVSFMTPNGVTSKLISDILTYVSDPVDLASFACTHSYLRFEAIRALYTTVKLASLRQTARFCRTITLHTPKSIEGLREYPGVHVQSLTFRPRALHTEYPPLPLNPCPNTVDHTPRPTAAFFRLLSEAIATLPHLTTLDLAWGFLYRHTHPTWTLDRIGTHRFLRTVHIDGVEDANALERFLVRHRPSDREGGCVGITSFENRSWLDLLDPSSPRGARVLKQFSPGLLPIMKTFSGPANKVKVWSWGYGSADEELAGIHEALAGNREHASGQENKPVGCGIINFTYVSKTLVEDVISLVGTYLPDVVHLTIEGYELGKTPLPEKLPYLPNLESITIVARATRPTEKPCGYRAVSYTRDSLGEAQSATSEITIWKDTRKRGWNIESLARLALNA